MQRGFTLVEVLVVLAIVALGWLWVPSLFQSSTTAASQRFAEYLSLAHARAQMEASQRQQQAALAVSAMNDRLALFVKNGAEVEMIWQVSIPAEVSFDVRASSSGGTPGVFDIFADSQDELWRGWWLTPAGPPVRAGGVMVFEHQGARRSYFLTAQGGFVTQGL